MTRNFETQKSTLIEVDWKETELFQLRGTMNLMEKGMKRRWKRRNLGQGEKAEGTMTYYSRTTLLPEQQENGVYKRSEVIVSINIRGRI